MISDLVTHDLHNVVAVSDETERECSREDGELPDGYGCLGLRGFACVPRAVDDGPGTDGVSDVVGAVGEGGGAGGEDLDEGVGVLDFVGVFLCVAVDTLHAAAFGCAVDTSLRGVDVVVYSVEGADDEHGGDTLQGDEHVLLLVDLARLDLVLMEVAHGPAEGSLLGAELGVEALLALGDEFLIAGLLVLGDVGGNSHLFGVAGGNALLGVVALLGLLHLLVLLDDGVVGDDGSLGAILSGTLKEKGTLEDVVPANGVVTLDDLGV